MAEVGAAQLLDRQRRQLGQLEEQQVVGEEERVPGDQPHHKRGRHHLEDDEAPPDRIDDGLQGEPPEATAGSTLTPGSHSGGDMGAA
jgi:hypothetical protein